MNEGTGGAASRTTDPAAGTSAVTDVSLREYLMAQINAAESRSDIRFEAMKQQVQEAFAASQLAIDKADTATEKRFEGVNEFRAALADQATTFVTQDALISLGEKLQLSIERNRDDLDNLSKRIDIREGELQGSRITKGTLVTATTIAIGVIGLMVVLASYFSTH